MCDIMTKEIVEKEKKIKKNVEEDDSEIYKGKELLIDV